MDFLVITLQLHNNNFFLVHVWQKQLYVTRAFYYGRGLKKKIVCFLFGNFSLSTYSLIHHFDIYMIHALAAYTTENLKKNFSLWAGVEPA